jgi:hypothetical protein
MEPELQELISQLNSLDVTVSVSGKGVGKLFLIGVASNLTAYALLGGAGIYVIRRMMKEEEKNNG